MAASHARKRTWTPEIVRQRIRTSMIMRRLTDHVLGNVKMSPSQVAAGLGLLRKTLPDLSQVDHSGSVEMNPDELTRAQLMAIAAGSSEIGPGEGRSEPEPGEVH